MWCWHKWEDITTTYKRDFEGVIIDEERGTPYRYCKKCFKIQEYFFDSQGGYYVNLNDIKTEIVRKKYLTKEIRS